MEGSWSAFPLCMYSHHAYLQSPHNPPTVHFYKDKPTICPASTTTWSCAPAMLHTPSTIGPLNYWLTHLPLHGASPPLFSAPPRLDTLFLQPIFGHCYSPSASKSLLVSDSLRPETCSCITLLIENGGENFVEYCDAFTQKAKSALQW